MPKANSQVKRDYFWNTAASAMSAGSSMLLLLVVTQFMGAYAGGIFALAFAVAQQFQSVGAFEMRLYQATDVESRFSFGTYHASRILTCSLMVIGVIGYAIQADGFSQDALLIILVAFLRVFDAFEDVFHGEFQRLGRLDVGARAAFFRTLATTVCFAALVAISRDLFIACVVTIAISLVVLVVLNVPPAKAMFSLRPQFTRQPLGRLLFTCLPLFIGAFLAIYLTNAPKFGIENYLSKEEQAYYGIVFMPALMINLLSGLVFKPLLTSLAKNWLSGNTRGFFATVKRGLKAIGLASAAMFVVGYLAGIPLLGFLYGVDLGAYKPELMTLIVGGAFNATGILIYYVLVTMRLQRAVLMGYAVAALAVFVATTILVPRFGMMGACLSYDIAMAVLALVWLVVIAVVLRRQRGRATDGFQELRES